MSRKYDLKSRNTHEMPCQKCKANGILAQRLNPINWHQHTMRLCTKHQKELGYHPVDWGRGGYSGGKMPGDK